jgi:hypothetical protein
MVSFDVSNLFPSVPLDTAINSLKKWLNSLQLDHKSIDEYIRLTNLVMNQNFFQFQGKFYQQDYGAAMGNPLSPFIANVFMTHFETEFKNKFSYFPSVFVRYVDDIFAIFDTTKYSIDQFINDLNSLYPSIKFTYELEKNNQLAFLDLLLTRNVKISYDVYRKPTHTNNYIHHDSFVHDSHKLGAFHALVHRLVNIPLSKDNYFKELINIKRIASQNGFKESIIDNLIKKHKHKKLIQNTTTLTQNKNSRYIKLPFHPQLTKGLNKIFKSVDTKISFSSNNKLKHLLGNTKDKIDASNKSGIYKINCSSCDSAYIGQTRRNIKTRFKEHMAHYRYNRPEKSSIALHLLNEGHHTSEKELKLIKQTPNHLLDAYESIFIHKFKNVVVNNDKGPIPFSPLYSFLK